MMTASNKVLTQYAVSLVPVNAENQALLFDWRNQDEIRQQMISQQVISQAEHNAWFLGLAEKSDQQHFVIYYKNTPIGAINIKCHDGLDLRQSTHAEVGLYIANEKYRGNLIAFAPSLVINDYAFEQLNISQLSSKVRADNLTALKYNQQLGYDLLDEVSGFIPIQLSVQNYQKHTQHLKQFLNRGNRIVDK